MKTLYYRHNERLESVDGFLRPIIDQCNLQLVKDEGQPRDILVTDISGGSGRYEWPVQFKKLYNASQGTHKLTIVLIERKNSPNIDTGGTGFEENALQQQGGPQILSWLRRVRNAHFRTVDYHFTDGVWPSSQNKTNKASESWIISVINRMRIAPWQRENPTTDLDLRIEEMFASGKPDTYPSPVKWLGIQPTGPSAAPDTWNEWLDGEALRQRMKSSPVKPHASTLSSSTHHPAPMSSSDVKDAVPPVQQPADPRGEVSRAFRDAQARFTPAYLQAAQANLGPDFSAVLSRGMTTAVQRVANASSTIPKTDIDQRWEVFPGESRDAPLDPRDADARPWYKRTRGQLDPAAIQSLQARFMASVKKAQAIDQAQVNTTDINSSNLLVYVPPEVPQGAASRSLLTDLVKFSAPEGRHAGAMVLWQPPKAGGDDEKKRARPPPPPQQQQQQQPKRLPRDIISAEPGGKIPAATEGDVMVSLPKAVECYMAELAAPNWRIEIAAMWLKNINGAMGYVGVAPLRHRTEIRGNPELKSRHQQALQKTFNSVKLVADIDSGELDNLGVALK